MYHRHATVTLSMATPSSTPPLQPPPRAHQQQRNLRQVLQKPLAPNCKTALHDATTSISCVPDVPCRKRHTLQLRCTLNTLFLFPASSTPPSILFPSPTCTLYPLFYTSPTCPLHYHASTILMIFTIAATSRLALRPYVCNHHYSKCLLLMFSYFLSLANLTIDMLGTPHGALSCSPCLANTPSIPSSTG